MLRRIRRASLAVLRQEIEAVDPRALASFLPSWQGVDRHPAAGAGVDRLREALVPLQGLALPAQVWERDVLPRRVGAYSPAWLDQLTASGEVVWVGAGASGRGSGRVALYFRDDAAAIGPPPVKGPAPEPPSEPVHEALRERLAAAPCFFTDLLAELPAFAPEELQDGLWDLVWAGEVTNDAFAPLRAPRLTLARAQREQRAPRAAGTALRRAARRRAGDRPGPLVAGGDGCSRAMATRASDAACSPSCCSSATASSRASRCSPSRSAAASRRSTTRSAISRRSASAAAATSSRASAARSSRCPARSSGCARSPIPTRGPASSPRRSCSRRPTRRSRTAPRCAGPSRRTRTPAPPRGARSASPGAYVVLAGAEPVLYVERGGRALVTLVEAGDERVEPALRALADFVTEGRAKLKLSIERVDGEPVVGSPIEALLVDAGFRQGPRKLTLSA